MAIAAGPLTITPVPPLLGAEVGGVDLTRSLGAATFGYIVQAPDANSVLVFMRADGVHGLKRQVRAPSSPPQSGAGTR